MLNRTVIFFLELCWLVSSLPGIVMAQDRFALVIGNQTYQYLQPAKKSEADARLVSQTLADIGFKVDLAVNLNRADFEAKLLQFSKKITPNAIVFLYYTGQGMQSNGKNFLLPTNVDFRQSENLPLEAIAVDQIINLFQVNQAEALIVVLDASRGSILALDNQRTPQVDGKARGLALVSGNQLGTLLAFSTSPGSIFFDGKGVNSVYAVAFSSILKEEGRSIEEILKITRIKVGAITNNQQIPWENSALTSAIIFNPKINQSAATAATDCDLAAAHPSDPERVGPSVDFANLNPQQAIPACQRAIANFPNVTRFKTLLARAYDKAGRGEDAAGLNEIAMKEGSLAAYHNMGNLYRKGLGVPQDLSKAFALYKYAAERGHVEDQSNIGVMLLNGDGVEQNFEQARYWLEQAAAQNWADAMDRLGLMALNGQGGEKDPIAAVIYFERSANLGSRNGMVNFANAFRKGEVVAEDKAKAMELYQAAALLGARAAFAVLGSMYKTGEGGLKDSVRAAFWFTLASREGDNVSMQMLLEIKKNLSDDQIKTLDRMIEDWDTHRFG
ncbi:MAG: caspase family protein [Cypionkella sp.]